MGRLCLSRFQEGFLQSTTQAVNMEIRKQGWDKLNIVKIDDRLSNRKDYDNYNKKKILNMEGNHMWSTPRSGIGSNYVFDLYK